MKYCTIFMICVGLSSSALASIIAFDDFSGGTAGTSIAGSTDDYGHTWSVNGNDVLFSDENAAESAPENLGGSALLNGNFSKAAVGNNIIQVSMDLSPNGHSTGSNGKMTVGLYNKDNINKGYLNNLNSTAAPYVSFLFFFTDNANHEGKMTWNIQDGTTGDSSWNGGKKNLTDDTYTMVLSYNFDTGDVFAEVTDTADNVIVSDTATTSAGLSFDVAGFGWGSTDTSIEDMSTVTNFTMEAIPEPAVITLLLLASSGVLVAKRFMA